MYGATSPDTLERLELLEHLSNQHDILLIGLIDVIAERWDTKPDTSIGTEEENM